MMHGFLQTILWWSFAAGKSLHRCAALSDKHVMLQVLGEKEEDSRLLLCEATAMIMRQCFQLLGIKPLYRI